MEQIAPLGPGVPGWDAVGQSARHGGRSGDAGRAVAPGRVGPSRALGGPGRRRHRQAAAAAGVAVTVQRVGTMLTPFFTDTPVRDYA